MWTRSYILLFILSSETNSKFMSVKKVWVHSGIMRWASNLVHITVQTTFVELNTINCRSQGIVVHGMRCERKLEKGSIFGKKQLVSHVPNVFANTCFSFISHCFWEFSARLLTFIDAYDFFNVKVLPCKISNLTPLFYRWGSDFFWKWGELK